MRLKPSAPSPAALLAVMLSSACFAIGCDADLSDGDAGPRDDGGVAGGSAPDDASDTGIDEDDGGVESCDSDADCSNDDSICNGVERCVQHACEWVEPPHCSIDHPCVEHLSDCDCDDPDLDNDGIDATECLEPGQLGDCNDHDNQIYRGQTEVCGPAGSSVDEDCEPTTFQNEATQDGDADGDGRVSDLCFNLDADGERHGGTDCLDRDDATYPDADEQCDELDNDCDGITDEGSRNGGPVVPHGLQVPFYPDGDLDGYGDHDADAASGCSSDPPTGYVPAFLPHDCDDERIDVHFGVVEVCDGVDNDCDGLEDADDDVAPVLLAPFDFDDTTVTCVPDPVDDEKATWQITACPDDYRWCTGRPETGCSTDATTIDNCRSCGNTCTFACGETGCDEVGELSLGINHSCAITSEGQAACWGQGGNGLLGIGVVQTRSVPTPVIDLPDRANRITSGPTFSCATLGDTDELHCWGENLYGQLANGDASEFSAVPLPVKGYGSQQLLSAVKAVALSDRFGCAVIGTGDLVCWGESANGQLANGEPDTTLTPRVPNIAYDFDFNEVGNATSVSAGFRHACAVTTDHELLCWGDNSDGQLGNREVPEMSEVALAVPGLGPVDSVAAGRNHTCAISEGDVYCWGLNSGLQLGRESDEDDATPGRVEGLGEIVQIGAGADFTCALEADGDVLCWGANVEGQRGDLDSEDSATPTRVSLDDVESLAVGGHHACAIATTGQAYCWGENAFGQLGRGNRSPDPQPIPIEIKPLDSN